MEDNRTLEDVWKENAGDEVKSRTFSPESFWKTAAMDCYGTDYYVITKKDIETLLAGGILRFPQNGGEYQCFLRLKGED